MLASPDVSNFCLPYFYLPGPLNFILFLVIPRFFPHTLGVANAGSTCETMDENRSPCSLSQVTDAV